MKIFNALRKRITASAQPCQSASSLPRHSLRMLLALSVLLALLAACGDESSSSVSPEPRQCEEQSDDCDDASSSSENISKNSSSSQKSADKGKSSSSEKSTKESSSSATTKNSSSSVDGGKSSSSVKKEDSSSSAVKASSSSVSPKSSSSEEVKQSSSSVVASSSSVASSETVKSSSSEYVPYNHRKALYSDSVLTGAYKQFTDTRNGRTYYYLTINGVDKNDKPASVTVMAENLNVGVMVDGKKDQSDNSKVERYCYGNDTTNCDKYGGLYQWAEMMQLPSECNTKSCADLIKPNHQGVCPEGWRLLTEDDFYIILHADGNRHGAEDVRATSFGGYNYSGYSLLGAGTHINPSTGGGFKNLGESTIWFYPTEDDYEDFKCAADGIVNKGSATASTNVSYKQNGHSVRCVMVK